MMLNSILPYFIVSVEDEDPIVQVEAAESGIDLLYAIEIPVALSPTDFKVYQMYVLPMYHKLGSSQSLYVRSTLVKLLGKLCVVGRRLIEQGIINQISYFASSKSAPSAEEQKLAHGHPFANKSISNLDAEIEETANTLRATIFDASVQIPRAYQSAIVRHLDKVLVLVGRKNFEAVVSLVFSMLNTKESQLVAKVFECAPKISEGTGIAWVKDLLSCFDMYMTRAEELVVYNIIKCFTYFASSNLLTSREMINTYKRFSSFLVHPNQWLRSAAIDYCSTVSTRLKDGEIFLYICPLLQGFLKNFLIVTTTSHFHNFLISPLSRTVLDLIEANVTETLNLTRADELAKVMIEKEIDFKERNPVDTSLQRKANFDAYCKTMFSLTKQLPQFSICYKIMGFDVMEGYFGEPTKSVYQINSEFKVREEEAKEYVDECFAVHRVPERGNYWASNNGNNGSETYRWFLGSGLSKEIWKSVYESSSLCKALKFYPQNEKAKDKPAFSQSTTDKWKAWKPQGRLMLTLNSHKAPVYAIDKSEDATLLATGSADGICNIWDTTKLKDSFVFPLVSTVNLGVRVTCLRFIDGNCFAVGSRRGTILIGQIAEAGVVKLKETLANDEGAVVNYCRYLGSEGQNVAVYATQQAIHVHDVRAREDVSRRSVGSEYGFATALTAGRDESSCFVGTASGYVMNYDVRFNLVSEVRRHSRATPVTDLCVYLSQKHPKNSAPLSPMLFVASAGENSQVDLCAVDKDATYWSFVVGSSKLAFQSYVPFMLRAENHNCSEINKTILKQLSKDFHTLSNIEQQHNELLNNNYEFKDFYDKIKEIYKSNSIIYKILCPRVNSEESAPLLLTAGADRVVRHWHLGSLNCQDEMRTNAPDMARRSFLVVSPDDREVEYLAENFGEKVLYERPLKDKSRAGTGRSGWQTLNGVSYLKEKASKVTCAGHMDAIVNMELLDFDKSKFLVTCGRDNLVKLWV